MKVKPCKWLWWGRKKRSKDLEQRRGPWELSGIQHVWILSSVLSFWHSLIESKVKVKLTQSCLTVCDPMEWILQARILEWLAVPLSRASSQPRNQTQVSCIAAEPQGTPRILKWVACLFSRGPSWPRNWTGVSCIAGQLSYQGSPKWKWKLLSHVWLFVTPWVSNEFSSLIESSYNSMKFLQMRKLQLIMGLCLFLRPFFVVELWPGFVWY